MTAATPDSPPEAVHLVLEVLPVEFFPNVAAVRRFFGGEVYFSLCKAIHEAILIDSPMDVEIPQALKPDVRNAAAFAVQDLEALGGLVPLPEETPLDLEGEPPPRTTTEERLRSLLFALGCGWSEQRWTAPLGELLEQVRRGPRAA